MKKDELFEVIETIQEGMLATSYKARERRLDRTVLLKVLQPGRALDQDMVQRFRREATLQARLSHPNIVKVHQFGPEGDFYIATEFIDGTTFEQRLRERGRLTAQELAPFVLQVARALEYAHGQGVVHRDLKPANIMIDARGDAKLTDFGLAFARDLGSITQEGSVVGTPAYMSPEQSRGRKTDARTDIFSLGIVIYESLVGINPFKADTFADSLSLVLNKEPMPLEQAAPGVPAEVARVVGRMLVKDPGKRTATIKEVIDVFSTLGPATAPPKSRALSIALIAVALAAAGLAVLFSRTRAPAGGPPANLAESLIPVPITLTQTDSGRESAPVRPAPTLEAAAVLPPPTRLCSLKLSVTPWAEIAIDGRPAGVTPLSSPLVLAAGRHVIEMKNPYFPTVLRTVVIDDASVSLSVDLAREIALADIRVTPWAEVSIDGRVVDTTPLGRPIPVSLGAHLLTISHPDLGARSETIRTDSAKTYRFTYNLTRH
jgi:hypothetical protein